MLIGAPCPMLYPNGVFRPEPEMLAIAGGFAEVNARGLTVLAERIG